MDQKKIGAFLKELRKNKGMTQEQLAEYLNVSGRTVSRWETGSNMPDLDILIILSDYYSVDIRELLDGERKGEKMDKDKAETILKVSDYGSLKEKMLIRKIYSIIIAGIVAWGISLITMLCFMKEVTGGIVILIFSLLSIFIYGVCMFFIKANKTADGFITSLIGAFIAITVVNLIQMLIFFGSGSYHNYGIIGVYYSLLVFIIVFLASGITTTVINNKRERKNKLKNHSCQEKQD